MRRCRKCEETIPNRVTIDGRERNLHNRKFCLKCSPFGSRNTKKDDPSLPAKKKGKYSEWSKEEKLIHRARVYRKGLLRKDELVEMAGGGCKDCGYNKCFRALHFHHIDPSAKSFSLTLYNLWCKSWNDILAEFQKCKLLCANCHAEEEDEGSEHGLYRKIIKERWPDLKDELAA
tara:strand:+ start:2380 stop:2904 length:525 start_codon:yes stop_codon:yes gene_type:complete